MMLNLRAVGALGFGELEDCELGCVAVGIIIVEVGFREGI